METTCSGVLLMYTTATFLDVHITLNLLPSVLSASPNDQISAFVDANGKVRS